LRHRTLRHGARLRRTHHGCVSSSDRLARSGVVLRCSDQEVAARSGGSASEPLFMRDGIHDGVERNTVVFDLSLMVEDHPKATHHRQAPLVRELRDRDHPGQVERHERVVEPSGCCFRSVAIASMLVSHPPADLDVVRIGLLVVQAAHPEEPPSFMRSTPFHTARWAWLLPRLGGTHDVVDSETCVLADRARETTRDRRSRVGSNGPQGLSAGWRAPCAEGRLQWWMRTARTRSS
jgi:hypothetical protein